VVVIATGDAEARHKADGHFGDVLDGDRNAIDLGQDNVFYVLDPITFQNVVIAAVVEKTNAADVHRLLADLDLAPAHIDVGVTERGQHLRNGDAVYFELGQIHV